MKPAQKIFLAVIIVFSAALFFSSNIRAVVGWLFERRTSHLVPFQYPSPSEISSGIDQDVNDHADQFRPVHVPGVLILNNVCIEPDPQHRKVAVQKRLKEDGYLNADRQVLVAYNAKRSETKVHTVGAHGYVRVKDWEIIYRTGDPPSGVNITTSYVAYFMTTSCDGNLWLFFENSLRGLYTVVKQTNRLQSKEKNIVYTREPLWEISSLMEDYVQCWDPTRFEEMLLSLNFRQPHDTIHKAAPYTCYKTAVFGSPPGKKWASALELAEHIITYLKLDNMECPGGPTVTLLQRKNRVILNMDELHQAAVEVGFNRTNVTVFEGLDFMEQMRIIRCTDVFVGVHGAGMAWGLFLRKGSVLVEIAWPQQGWPFLYSGRFKKYNSLQIYQHQAAKVFLNFDTFSQQCHRGKPFTEEEKHRLSSNPKPEKHEFNQWKWGDVLVDPAKFKKLLIEIRNKKFKGH